MNLIIAGGGTGGHVFPAIAIAQAVHNRAPQTQITFVGTIYGLEQTAVPRAGFSFIGLRASGLKGKSVLKKITALWRLAISIIQSIGILRRLRADVVLGVGGYASAPVLIAALILRIPTAICEQNSIPGFTNRVLGRFVKTIFGSFAAAASFFGKNHYNLVGNPVRQDFVTAQPLPPRAQASHLLVIGGSLGARIFNETLPKAAQILQNRGIALQITHQCGKQDKEEVTAAYQRAGVNANVFSFIDDMVKTYQAHDILVCRAGATTCAEVTALGLVSVMVPFPSAIYDHQTLNAKELAQTGATIWLPQTNLTPDVLANQLERLLDSADLRNSIAKNALSLGKRDAAAKIAAELLNGLRQV